MGKVTQSMIIDEEYARKLWTEASSFRDMALQIRWNIREALEDDALSILCDISAEQRRWLMKYFKQELGV